MNTTEYKGNTDLRMQQFWKWRQLNTNTSAI